MFATVCTSLRDFWCNVDGNVDLSNVHVDMYMYHVDIAFFRFIQTLMLLLIFIMLLWTCQQMKAISCLQREMIFACVQQRMLQQVCRLPQVFL